MTSAERRGMLADAEFEAMRASGRWSELEDYLRAEIREDPSNHWLLTNVAMACNEQRRAREAKEWSDLAYGIEPRCPLVRWDRACIYEKLSDVDRAIAFWRALVDTPVEEQRSNPCWESEDWSQSLIADCWYRLSLACARSGSVQDSAAAEVMYKRMLEGGTRSIYTLNGLERALARARGSKGQ